MTKLQAGVLSVSMVAVTLFPIVENWRDRPEDGFPLSYYPMFTARRSDSVRITYLVGLDSAGNRSAISYREVGPGGLNQVRRQLARIAERGDPQSFCRSVAAKVAAQDAGSTREISTLRLVTGSYRLSQYLAGTLRPFAEREHASCEVEDGQP
ncbi:MAG: hypothetical protein H0V43_10105 [Gemmatimonadales bacterium]|nr:hypothetical protein [Gemmatimonadales bacterium]MBA3553574.1 hypothetical protein [Gemmatimonadales bacterium]